MKAILVMDMPEKCDYCPLGRILGMEGQVECQASEYIGNRIAISPDGKMKPEWCPLVQMPEKMELCGRYDGEYYADGGKLPTYKIGWNACIDAIEGSSNDRGKA